MKIHKIELAVDTHEFEQFCGQESKQNAKT